MKQRVNSLNQECAIEIMPVLFQPLSFEVSIGKWKSNRVRRKVKAKPEKSA